MFCFFTLKIENTKGEVFELTHNTNDYVVAGIQGLTRPPTSVNTSACAGIDGSFFNSARMEQRNIVIDLILRGDIEGNRQRLYRIFPAKTPCTVYFKNWNRDVKIKGYVETLEGDIFSVREQMQISIICPKPFWEDMQAVYDELSSVVKRFHFPFSIEEPIPIAELNSSGGVTIENKGDVETGFICRITMQTKRVDSGLMQVDHLKIINHTTGQAFGLDYPFQVGDEITINTLSGELSVTLNRGGTVINLLRYLSGDSTWIKLASGSNYLTFSADPNFDLVYAVFRTAILYGGV